MNAEVDTKQTLVLTSCGGCIASIYGEDGIVEVSLYSTHPRTGRLRNAFLALKGEAPEMFLFTNKDAAQDFILQLQRAVQEAFPD